MGRRGPQPLPDAVKGKRGTLQPCRRRRPAGAPEPRVEVQQDAPRDYVAIANGYIRDVLAGRIVASRLLRLACERQERDRHRATVDPSWPFVWSETHVIDACGFIEHCPHIEGRWRSPTITLEPAQVFWLALLFGWRHRSDVALRRFSVWYLEVARKAAKSTLMAAVVLYHLACEHEPGASAIFGASTGQQARICFRIAQKMIRRSAWLRDLGFQGFANAIIVTSDTVDGDARPVNSKASTLDGLNPSCIVLDESHAQDFTLHDVLKSSQGARVNPLLLAPTTAGYDQLSVGFALRTSAIKVLEQIFESDHLLATIYAIDDGDDWKDEAVWIKANPLLGVTPKIENVRTYCRDAQQTPQLESEFRVKVCSEWLNSGQRWLSTVAWDACADPSLKLEDFVGEPCWIGGDLAQLDDLAAIALVFKRDDLVVAFVKCYLPRLVVDARARAVPAYRLWADAGIITLTDGNMIDYSSIEADIRRHCETFDVRDICFDQFGSVQIAGNLSNDGLPARVEPKNLKTFTGPARELETRVTHKRFRHDANTCLRWMASNCVVRRGVDDSLLPKKDGPESPNKIDGIDALLLALGGMARHTPTYASAYDDPETREPFMVAI